jgi:hypothetical protein
MGVGRERGRVGDVLETAILFFVRPELWFEVSLGRQSKGSASLET